MLRRFFQSALCALTLVAFLVSQSGCYTGVDGRTRAGLPFKDRFTTDYGYPLPEAQRAVLATLQVMGEVISHDVVKNVVVAQVDRHRVWVRMMELEQGNTRIVTQARGPMSRVNMDLAMATHMDIALELQNGLGGYR